VEEEKEEKEKEEEMEEVVAQREYSVGIAPTKKGDTFEKCSRTQKRNKN
jgi:hypothetical protein